MAKEANYCHDEEIIGTASKLGIKDRHIINQALSIGEATAYGYTDAPEGFLNRVKALLLRNKRNQPKQRLSKRQKADILKRHSTE